MRPRTVLRGAPVSSAISPERKIGLEAQDEHFALRVREIGDGQFEEGEIIAVRRGLASRSEGCGEFVQNGCALVPLVATEKRDRHIVGDAIEPTAELGFLPVSSAGLDSMFPAGHPRRRGGQVENRAGSLRAIAGGVQREPPPRRDHRFEGSAAVVPHPSQVIVSIKGNAPAGRLLLEEGCFF
jgi:hypothetical protein